MKSCGVSQLVYTQKDLSPLCLEVKKWSLHHEMSYTSYLALHLSMHKVPLVATAGTALNLPHSVKLISNVCPTVDTESLPFVSVTCRANKGKAEFIAEFFHSVPMSTS